MIKISIRDIIADLPPSILKKKIKEIDERSYCIKISDFNDKGWTDEFVRMKSLKDNKSGISFKRWFYISSNGKLKEKIVAQEIIPYKEYITFYIPSQDAGFTCYRDIYNAFIKTEENLKKVLKIWIENLNNKNISIDISEIL